MLGSGLLLVWRIIWSAIFNINKLIVSLVLCLFLVNNEKFLLILLPLDINPQKQVLLILVLKNGKFLISPTFENNLTLPKIIILC